MKIHPTNKNLQWIVRHGVGGWEVKRKSNFADFAKRVWSNVCRLPVAVPPPEIKKKPIVKSKKLRREKRIRSKPTLKVWRVRRPPRNLFTAAMVETEKRLAKTWEQLRSPVTQTRYNTLTKRIRILQLMIRTQRLDWWAGASKVK